MKLAKYYQKDNVHKTTLKNVQKTTNKECEEDYPKVNVHKTT